MYFVRVFVTNKLAVQATSYHIKESLPGTCSVGGIPVSCEGGTGNGFCGFWGVDGNGFAG